MSTKPSLRRKTLSCASMRKKCLSSDRLLRILYVFALVLPTAELMNKPRGSPRRSALRLRGPSKSGTCQASDLLRCLPCLALSVV